MFASNVPVHVLINGNDNRGRDPTGLRLTVTKQKLLV